MFGHFSTLCMKVFECFNILILFIEKRFETGYRNPLLEIEKSQNILETRTRA